MTRTTRREFFGRWISNRARRAGRPVENDRIVKLGPLTAFPVGTETDLQIEDEDFIVESRPEGIRMRNGSSGECCAVVMSEGGQLFGKVTERWPDNAVLSILTGDRYFV